MSPPEHFLFGALAVTVVYAAQGKHGLRRWVSCCMLTGIAAIAPDLDSGVRAYGSNDAWIGHRGWTHSILFAALFGIAMAMAGRFAARRLLSPALFFFCSFLGVCLHILGDMPTPGGSWGGLPIFFPHPARFGGWSKIGWYDPVLFWKTCGVFLLSAVFVFVASAKQLRKPAQFLAGAIALGGFLLAGVHIHDSTYTDSVSWHGAQERKLKQMPWPVYPITVKIGRIGMQLFARVRTR